MTTVLIWNNNLWTNDKNVMKEHAVIGHAAVHITDDFVVPMNKETCTWNADPAWVSYWPGEGEASINMFSKWVDKKVSNVVNMTRACKGAKSENFFVDLMVEGYAPDHVIRIEHTKGDTTGRLLRMGKEWEETMNKKDGPNFRASRKNCSRISSRVLRAGFASELKLGGIFSANARFGNVVHGMWTPVMVKRMALEAASKTGGRELTWAEFLDELHLKRKISKPACEGFKLYKRRSENRGAASQATPRFVLQNEKLSDTGDNINAELRVMLQIGDMGKTFNNVKLGGLDEFISDVVLQMMNSHGAEQGNYSVKIRFHDLSPWRLLLGNDPIVDITNLVELPEN